MNRLICVQVSCDREQAAPHLRMSSSETTIWQFGDRVFLPYGGVTVLGHFFVMLRVRYIFMYRVISFSNGNYELLQVSQLIF